MADNLNRLWRVTYTKDQILQAAANQVPLVGDNGNWWRWDINTSAWVDTGISAQGPQGPQGPGGLTEQEANAKYLKLDGGGTIRKGWIAVDNHDGTIRTAFNGDVVEFIIKDESGNEIRRIRVFPSPEPGTADKSMLSVVGASGVQLSKSDSGTEEPIILSGIKAPVSDTDAANKRYVQDALSAFIEHGLSVSAPDEWLQAFSVSDASSGKESSVTAGGLNVRDNGSPNHKWLKVEPDGLWCGIYKENSLDLEASSALEFGYLVDESGVGHRTISFHGLPQSQTLIRSVEDPIINTDASNKKYVDETVAAAVGDIGAILDSINGEVV